MGITIHYSGTFSSNASLSGMIEEAVAFAEANNWKHHVLEASFPEVPPIEPDTEIGRYGLLVIPPECEPVHLIFNQDRQLGFYCDLRTVLIQDLVIDELTGESKWVTHNMDSAYKPSWGAFTKTQFAGSGIHIKVVELLKQLVPKYFSEFKVTDETDFWVDDDENKLRQRLGDDIIIDMDNFDKADPKYRLPE